MKRAILLTRITIILILFAASNAQATFQGSLKNVSITDALGANSPPTASFTYTQDGDTFTFDASGTRDSDGSITQYAWDLGDGQMKNGVTAVATIPESSTLHVTLTVTDNQTGISIQQQTVTNAPTFHVAVNFQPPSVSLPNGYLLDSGTAYNAQLGRGWTRGPSSMGTRDRDNSLSPDQAYDTMIHVDPASVWEIAVPNGTYTVTVCSGDATFPAGTQNIQAEGVSVINNKILSASTRWLEETATITATDGRLTITFSGSTSPARLCWLTITSVN